MVAESVARFERGDGKQLSMMALSTLLSTGGLEDGDWIGLVRDAGAEGVEALVYDVLGTGMLGEGTEQARQALRPAALRSVAYHELLVRVATTVVAEIEAAGVRALLLKGLAWGRLLYEQSYHRAGTDLDVLVEPGGIRAAAECLNGLGLEEVSYPWRNVSRQQVFVWRGAGASEVFVDLHEAISNRPLLTRVFPFEQLYAESMPVPGLAPEARTLGLSDAFLYGCAHRIGHSPEERRLIWLYDLHLLLGALGREGRLRETADRAVEKGLGTVCSRQSREAVEVFGSEAAEEFCRIMADRGSEDCAGLSGFLEVEGSFWRRLKLDLRGLPGLGAKRRYVREMLFPPIKYMLWKYPGWRRRQAPWLYVRRGWGGMRKLMGHGRGKGEGNCR